MRINWGGLRICKQMRRCIYNGHEKAQKYRIWTHFGWMNSETNSNDESPNEMDTNSLKIDDKQLWFGCDIERSISICPHNTFLRKISNQLKNKKWIKNRKNTTFFILFTIFIFQAFHLSDECSKRPYICFRFSSESCIAAGAWKGLQKWATWIRLEK